MPQSIPPGLTREHVLQALADLDARDRPPVRHPTGYELVHDGKRYPPKAVVGLACPLLPGPDACSPTSSAAARLPARRTSSCGSSASQVVKKRSRRGREEKQAGKDWSEQEVGLIVADYFAMLEKRTPRQALQQDRTPQGPRPATRRAVGRLHRVQARQHQCRPGRPGAALRRGLQATGQLPDACWPRRSRRSSTRTRRSWNSLPAHPTDQPGQGRHSSTFSTWNRIIEDPPERDHRPQGIAQALAVTEGAADRLRPARRPEPPTGEARARSSSSTWSGTGFCTLGRDDLAQKVAVGRRRRSATAWGSTCCPSTTRTSRRS